MPLNEKTSMRIFCVRHWQWAAKKENTQKSIQSSGLHLC